MYDEPTLEHYHDLFDKGAYFVCSYNCDMIYTMRYLPSENDANPNELADNVKSIMSMLAQVPSLGEVSTKSLNVSGGKRECCYPDCSLPAIIIYTLGGNGYGLTITSCSRQHKNMQKK